MYKMIKNAHDSYSIDDHCDDDTGNHDHNGTHVTDGDSNTHEDPSGSRNEKKKTTAMIMIMLLVISRASRVKQQTNQTNTPPNPREPSAPLWV